MNRISGNRWINLVVSYLALIGGFITYIGWTPSIANITTDLALGYAEVGSLSSVTALVAGVFTLIGGLACARWGAKKVLLVGLFAGFCGHVLFSYADGYSLAITGRALSGISTGLLFVGTYTLAAEWFHNGPETQRAMGVMLSGDGVGMLLSLFGFAFLLSGLGWRTGLLVEAFFLFLILIVVVFATSDAVKPARDTSGLSMKNEGARTGLQGSLNVLKKRNVMLAVVFWIGGVGTLALIATWVPSILVDQAHWSEETAGLVTSLFSVIGMAAAFFSADIARKVSSVRLIIVLSAILIVAGFVALTVALMTQNYVLVAMLMPIIGLGVYAGEPLFLALAIDSVHKDQSGVVNGLIIGLPWITSGFLFPYAAGSIKDMTGSFTGAFAVATIAVILLCLIPAFLLKADSAAENSRTIESV